MRCGPESFPLAFPSFLLMSSKRQPEHLETPFLFLLTALRGHGALGGGGVPTARRWKASRKEGIASSKHQSILISDNSTSPSLCLTFAGKPTYNRLNNAFRHLHEMNRLRGYFPIDPRGSLVQNTQQKICQQEEGQLNIGLVLLYCTYVGQITSKS